MPASEWLETERADIRRVIRAALERGIGNYSADVAFVALRRIEDYADALSADLATATATIEAQRLALATMREALELREFDDGTWAVGVRVSHYTFVRNLLAQPDDTTAALAGAVLEAADDCFGLLLMLAEDLVRNGRSAESLTEVHAAIVRFDRARAALRGAGAEGW